MKIEFPAALVREIRSEVEQDHERGTLFGTATRPPNARMELRALTTRRDHEVPRVAGMELVGVYVNRTRGEVFLTDDDLLYMERFQARMALVIAGPRAGFFVRQADDTIQTIRSYEEFSVAAAAHRPEPLARPPSPPPPPPPPVRSAWKTILQVVAFLAVPAAAVAYLGPLLEDRPIQISVKESGGQLTASWELIQSERSGRLEITDAGVRTSFSIVPGASSAVYQPHGSSLIGNQGVTHMVLIRLTVGTRTGSAFWSAPQRPVPTGILTLPSPQTQAEHLSGSAVADLQYQLKQLRWQEAAHNAEIVELSKRAERLENPRNRAGGMTAAQDPLVVRTRQVSASLRQIR